MNLSEFANNGLLLLKHKDLLRKQIKEIKTISETEFEVVYMDRTLSVTATPDFEKPVKGTIICQNSKHNVDAVVAAWTKLVVLNTAIIFLNSDTGTNWSLSPHVHQRIAGSEDIEKGVNAIYKNSI